MVTEKTSLKREEELRLKNGELKENFCGACLTIPLAFAGAGTAFGAESKAKLKQWAIFITIISILFTVYFIWIRKCKTCQLR
jgi:hypothetical protein